MCYLLRYYNTQHFTHMLCLCVCVVLITHRDYSPEELSPFGLPNGDAAFYVRSETAKYKRRAQIFSSVYGNIY